MGQDFNPASQEKHLLRGVSVLPAATPARNAPAIADSSRLSKFVVSFPCLCHNTETVRLLHYRCEYEPEKKKRG